MTDTGTAVERYHDRSPGLLTEQDQKSIEYQARAIAVLDSRLKGDDAKQKSIALAVTLFNYGLPITVTNAKKLHLIGGEVMESAQLLVGLMERSGHEIRVVEEGDTRAVVRGWRFGAGEPHEVVYTIEQARRSGALDEWVERWENTNSGKRFCAEKLVLKTDGVVVERDTPLPAWAKKEIETGRVKRFEAWHSYRSDMLVNRAIRRLAKRMGGDSLLGVIEDDEQSDRPVRSDPPVEPRRDEVDHDDIVDAELVGDHDQVDDDTPIDVVPPQPETGEQPPLGYDDTDPQRPFK